ncbi:tRNA-modifying protein YgfZ [Paraglaciecola sp. 2405UD69-4]|uniref:tRNA-modifying protein YgfZ n=1 Tax=Paraglaciecola sp. 2405UD69-4 TaxID=3391836 RepID=UPI0039C96CBF
MSVNPSEITNTSYTCELNEKGIIELKGQDRITYLQGQVTADIESLSESTSLLSCHCDFKGKVWSVSTVLPWKESLLLLTHSSVLTTSLTELKKYGVFAKVEIENTSENWQVFGGKGPKFEDHIIKNFGQLPKGHQSILSSDAGIVVSIETPSQRYLVLQQKGTQAPQLENEKQSWEFDDIMSGLAEVRENTSNEYVPQMLNLQALNAINFEKGCYMGQEVVARTKYLGRNKRATFILSSDTNLEDLTGDSLEYQVGDNWRPGGKILRSAAIKNQTAILAVLPIDTDISSIFRLKSKPDIKFITQILPYEIQ